MSFSFKTIDFVSVSNKILIEVLHNDACCDTECDGIMRVPQGLHCNVSVSLCLDGTLLVQSLLDEFDEQFRRHYPRDKVTFYKPEYENETY